ncbi:MAG TPA: hypothetical protein VJQ79_10800 [Acidimicrobiia bacterium]|nr:hypothetical protein [Acidimicrobiia bacterium]
MTALALGGVKSPIPPRYQNLPEAATFGRLASRPSAIDPNAVQFFADWVGQCLQTDANGNVMLRPEFVPIGSQGRLRPPTSTTPANLTITKRQGDNQTAKAGGPVPVPLQVRIANPGGRIDGIAVLFEVRDFGASIAGTTRTSRLTDAKGDVEITGWVLGRAPGNQFIDVTVGSAAVSFKATAT